jgi:signal transduction histidine kinase
MSFFCYRTTFIKLKQVIKLLFVSTLIISSSHAVELTMADLQSVMIHKIIQFTEWPDENSLTTLNIGVYGATSGYISTLNQNYQQRKIRNKQLSVQHYDPFSNTSDIQVLIIKNKRVNEIKSIRQHFTNRNILLISEQSRDKKYLMVNLLTNPNGQVSFEINRSNILLADLKITKDIVLVGGTELDVAKLYDQAVTDLSNTQKTLNAKETEIELQLQQLQSQQQRINQLDDSIIDQQKKLRQQNINILQKDKELLEKEIKLKSLTSDLEIQVEIIDNSSAILDKIQNDLKLSSRSLENQEVKNLTLTDKIKANLNTLDQQRKQLEEKESEIRDKNLKLNKADVTANQQFSTIQTQKQLLLASLIIGTLFISLIIALYRIFIAKKKSSSLLETKNQQLQKTMNNLKVTQEQLIESEKMASLGGMVAGIAHEVNTPTGIVLTADTSLLENTQQLKQQLSNGTMTKRILNDYLDYAIECNNISILNIKRVASLIKTFKQVAVDQSNNEFCEFNLTDYIDEAIVSLQYLFEGNEHKLNIYINETIILNSYPEVYLQVINVLIENSLIHGFESMKQGEIDLSFYTKNDSLIFIYKDNGRGAKEAIIEKIFDPFYTTKRGAGSSGLGTHILYNMVTQLLKGKVSCRSNSPQGLIFEFELPLNLY